MSKSTFHKDSGRPGKHSGGSEALQNTPASFYFVVNELGLDYNYQPKSDNWGNPLPPDLQANYSYQNPGDVFKYHNGNVTRVEQCYWNCPGGLGTRGYICYNTTGQDEYGNIIENQVVSLETYSETTVFDLGPFLPCAYAMVDATITDVSVYDPPYDKFYALQFSHEPLGVSRAFFNGSRKYIAGSHASWLGSLVPEAYRNLEPHAPQSVALGGELGVLLGLMALTERPNRTNDAFSRHWNWNRWTGRRHEPVPPHGPPRGVIVHVALEPGQSRDDIYKFETDGFVVFG